MLRIIPCGAIALLLLASCNRSSTMEAKADQVAAPKASTQRSYYANADSTDGMTDGIKSEDKEANSPAGNLRLSGNVNKANADPAQKPGAQQTTAAATNDEPASPPRKRIRSADIKCRVDNVLQATLRLEHLVTQLDGGITESHIDNSPVETKEFVYKTDSLKKIQIIAPTATLTLRIPEKYLDSVVNMLSQSSGYVNYRTLKQSDVTLQYLSNNLKNQEQAKSPIDIDKGEKNRLDLLQYKDERQEAMVDRKIANLQLNDDVKYSTLTVNFFQPAITDITVQINPDAIIKTSLSTDLRASLQGGVEILRTFLLAFVALWPLWMLGVLAWFGYKKWGRIIRSRKSEPQPVPLSK